MWKYTKAVCFLKQLSLENVLKMFIAIFSDEVSSVRSDSPFIDVEKISSDEEAEHKAAVSASGEGKLRNNLCNTSKG